MPQPSEEQPVQAGSAKAVRQYYDHLGRAEADRLVKDIPGRVSFETHRRFLERFIKPGWRVLEIGAGPGRFTVVLAELGARVVVTDLSPVQLELNIELVAAAGVENAVEHREVVDIRDTSRYPTGSFDAVVAYGGPLSYAFEEERASMAGLLRVTRPGGVVLLSVMSLWGSWRARLRGSVVLANRFGLDIADAVISTGDLRHIPGMEHVCRMFTWEQLSALVTECGGRVLDGSASNWASLEEPEVLGRLERDPLSWDRFLKYEAAACAAVGARDGGTHIIVAVEA